MLTALIVGATLAMQAAPLDQVGVGSQVTPAPRQTNMLGGLTDAASVQVKAQAGDRLLLNDTVRVFYSRAVATRNAAEMLSDLCASNKKRTDLQLLMSPIQRDARRFRVAASLGADGSCAPSAQKLSLDEVVLLEPGKPVVLRGENGLTLQLVRR